MPTSMNIIGMLSSLIQVNSYLGKQNCEIQNSSNKSYSSSISNKFA